MMFMCHKANERSIYLSIYNMYINTKVLLLNLSTGLQESKKDYADILRV